MTNGAFYLKLMVLFDFLIFQRYLPGIYITTYNEAGFTLGSEQGENTTSNAHVTRFAFSTRSLRPLVHTKRVPLLVMLLTKLLSQ